MKNWIFVIIASFAISPCFGQNTLTHFFNQYSELENVNKLTLQGGLLQLAGNSAETKREKKALNKLNKLSAMWIEDFNPVSKKEVNYLLKSLRKDHFESLIMFRDNGSNVNFLIQENGRHITGVILLIDDDDSFFLINLEGNLDFEDLGNIEMDIEGMDYFKRLPKNRADLNKA